MNRLPNFIIIGAAKCGTTTLYKKLSAHPKIFMSTPKEPEFFARDDVYEKGLDWYSSLFESATDDQLCGEASTLYSLTTLFPETVSRMHDAIPQVKLIYILREPVERTYSYYTQLVKNYQNSSQNFVVNRTFEECLFPDQHPSQCERELFFAAFDEHLPDDPRTFIDGGRYMTHINNYLKSFNRKQLLILDFEELINQPNEVMVRVCDFLKLDSHELVDQDDVKENISSEHFDSIDIEIARQGISAKVKANPIGRKLVELMPKQLRDLLLYLYSTVFNKKNHDARPPKMNPETESYLVRLFKEDVQELERFWQRDLSSWKQKT